MGSDADKPAPPSIFLSYASADRAVARRLRDALAKAGLDVWLDEEELAGGEAWDAKIRQQIRACTYFMPVISATTEARREGYFRREWKLAVERTLDQADDVTFLVPVVIDGTGEQNARVPEKFTAVQWLRCPAGEETPALAALAERLMAEHGGAPVTPAPWGGAAKTPMPSAPPPVTARAARRSRGEEAAQAHPFLPFPAFPGPGHRLRFVYDLVVWTGRTIVALWVRLPRWLRAIAVVVIVFKTIGLIYSGSSSSEKPAKRGAAEEVVKALATAGGKAAADDDLGRKILAATGAAMDAFQTGKPLAVVTFTAGEGTTQTAAVAAFTGLYTKLAEGGRGAQVALSPAPLDAKADDAAALARAAALRCRWLLTGATHKDADGEFRLAVKLYDTAAQKVAWQAETKGDADEAESLGAKLAAEVLAQVTLETPAAAPAK